MKKKTVKYCVGIGTLTTIFLLIFKKIIIRSILSDPRRQSLHKLRYIKRVSHIYTERHTHTNQPEVGSPPHVYDDDFYFSVHFQTRVENNNIINHNIIDIHRRIDKSHAESHIPTAILYSFFLS